MERISLMADDAAKVISMICNFQNKRSSTMKKIKKTIYTVFTIAGCSLLLPESSYSEQPIRKTKEKAVVFSEIKPTSADLKKIGRMREAKARDGKLTAAENQLKQVYLVKIYAELPSTSSAINLYVGDVRIRECASFDGGVCFKIYEKVHLQALYGKPVRFVYSGKEYDLDASFPGKEETLQPEENLKKLPTLKEFLDADA